MTEVKSISFALDPSNVPSFLLDWEVTKLCNLNCSYCGTGIEGGHDNSTEHPPLNECLETIDFMYEYVDLYMRHKKLSQRKVILNVYGGESLFHPDIVTILEECRKRYQPYKDRWFLTITCTTNGIVGKNQWRKIVPLIDEFTLSYHSENLPKQKKQYIDNALYLKEQNKRFKCVILMHTKNDLFEDAESMIQFCMDNSLRYVPRTLDNSGDNWQYSNTQFSKLKTFWISQVPNIQKSQYNNLIENVGTSSEVTSINEGRACCGGRKISLNGDLKSFASFIPRQNFKDWYCSVNWFFLFVRQLDKKVFTNKDCQTSTTGLVEPLGTLDDRQKIINNLKYQFENNSMPIIQCKKTICKCGICSPKAESKQSFLDLINRNVTKDVFIKEN